LESLAELNSGALPALLQARYPNPGVYDTFPLEKRELDDSSGLAIVTTALKNEDSMVNCFLGPLLWVALRPRLAWARSREDLSSWEALVPVSLIPQMGQSSCVRCGIRIITLEGCHLIKRMPAKYLV
jgi:hypothetical protein